MQDERSLRSGCKKTTRATRNCGHIDSLSRPPWRDSIDGKASATPSGSGSTPVQPAQSNGHPWFPSWNMTRDLLPVGVPLLLEWSPIEFAASGSVTEAIVACYKYFTVRL